MAKKDGLFADFVEGVGSALDKVGDAVSEGADRVIDRIEDGAERVGDAVGDGKVISRIGGAVENVREVVEEVIDPLRDAGRAVFNTAGKVVNAVTLGVVDFESVEGDGTSLSVGIGKNRLTQTLDLDGSDGDIGVGGEVSTFLGGVTGGLSGDIDASDGSAGVTASVGGRLLDGELNSVGVERGVNSLDGQGGFERSVFVEKGEGEDSVRLAAGLTLNVDNSPGQTGVDFGGFVQREVDGELQGRAEAVITTNFDVSDSQAGLDKGVAFERFRDGAETSRVEAGTTANFGTSGDQVELDVGGFVERSSDGEQDFRAEAVASANVGFGDQSAEAELGGAIEVEIGSEELARAEFNAISGKVTAKDGVIAVEVADIRQGGFDAELIVRGEKVFEFRKNSFGVSTDLTDPDNLATLLGLAGQAGLPVDSLPSPEALAALFAGDPATAAGLLADDDAAVARLAEALGVEPELLSNVADLLAGDPNQTAGDAGGPDHTTGAAGERQAPVESRQEGNTVAKRGLLKDFLEEATDGDKDGIIDKVIGKAGDALSGTEVGKKIVDFVEDNEVGEKLGKFAGSDDATTDDEQPVAAKAADDDAADDGGGLLGRVLDAAKGVATATGLGDGSRIDKAAAFLDERDIELGDALGAAETAVTATGVGDGSLIDRVRGLVGDNEAEQVDGDSLDVAGAAALRTPGARVAAAGAIADDADDDDDDSDFDRGDLLDRVKAAAAKAKGDSASSDAADEGDAAEPSAGRLGALADIVRDRIDAAGADDETTDADADRASVLDRVKAAKAEAKADDAADDDDFGGGIVAAIKERIGAAGSSSADDADRDGVLNDVDVDDDNDGVLDTDEVDVRDQFLARIDEARGDDDGDGIANATDIDDDNDGLLDKFETD